MNRTNEPIEDALGLWTGGHVLVVAPPERLVWFRQSAGQAGHRVTVCEVGEVMRRLAEDRVDGVLVASSEAESILPALPAPLPVVVVGEAAPASFGSAKVKVAATPEEALDCLTALWAFGSVEEGAVELDAAIDRSVDEALGVEAADWLAAEVLLAQVDERVLGAIPVPEFEVTFEEAPPPSRQTDRSPDEQLRHIDAKWTQVLEADYYTLLDCAPTATARQIRQAYQDRCREFAAEGFSADVASARAAELPVIAQVLEEAYAVLSDPELREAYRANLLPSGGA